jgi:hypothetical protein
MQSSCPTCGERLAAQTAPPDPSSEPGLRVRCPACGDYTISFAAIDVAGRHIARLAPCTREASDTGNPLVITSANAGDLLRRYEATSVGTKARKLLQLVAARGPEPGTRVEINTFYDFPVVGAASYPEMVYLTGHAVDQGLLAMTSFVDWQGFTAGGCLLTPKGWETLSPVAGGLPGTCFVAMWFDESLHAAYADGIKPALEADCGYTVLQMSEHEHNNSITDEMLVQIRNSEFVVADVTGQRPNVYFDAGFALALGRPVIWSCREAEAGAIHFDTRQFSHILWQTPADLRRLLAARVKATIRPQGAR